MMEGLTMTHRLYLLGEALIRGMTPRMILAMISVMMWGMTSATMLAVAAEAREDVDVRATSRINNEVVV
jgi:hypothetical protein